MRFRGGLAVAELRGGNRLKPAEGARRSSAVPPSIHHDRFRDGVSTFAQGVRRARVCSGARRPGRSLQVPLREVALSGGEAAVRLYDTSGPQGHDVRDGLPKLREPWIAARRAAGSRRHAALLRAPRRDHAGDGVRRRARRAAGRIRPRRRWRAAAPSSRPTSTTSSSSR